MGKVKLGENSEEKIGEGLQKGKVAIVTGGKGSRVLDEVERASSCRRKKLKMDLLEKH